MTKLLLIVGFVLALTTLGFAAANASPPSTVVLNGQTMPIDYD